MLAIHTSRVGFVVNPERSSPDLAMIAARLGGCQMARGNVRSGHRRRVDLAAQAPEAEAVRLVPLSRAGSASTPRGAPGGDGTRQALYAIPSTL